MDFVKDYYANIEFKNKIYKSDGQTFEDFFVEVMNKAYPGFHAVKPQGSHGDHKNDGYTSDDGVFYQVYGPENIEKSMDYLLTKIKEDAPGLIKLWKGIKQIIYVVNDKYKGAQLMVHDKLQEIRSEIKKLSDSLDTSISLWTAKDLEAVFLPLDEQSKATIINPAFLVAEYIEDIDYKSLSEVVDFIINIETDPSSEKLNAPVFEKKIKFNNLSEKVSNRLSSFYLDNYELSVYFDNIGGYVAESLREKFNSIYNEAKLVINESPIKSDQIYFYIRKTACPPNPKNGYVNAVESLMAYYFETCDIFEEHESGEII